MKKLLLILAFTGAGNAYAEPTADQKKRFEEYFENQHKKHLEPGYIEQQHNELKKDVADALHGAIEHIKAEKAKVLFRYTKRSTAVFCMLGLIAMAGSIVEGEDSFVEASGLAIQTGTLGFLAGLTIDGFRYVWANS